MGKVRRNFEADESIFPFRAVVYRAHEIGRVLDVADGEQFVTRLGIQIGAVSQRIQEIGVVSTARNGLLKNRGV